jgi:adhesin transport system outer membrane protein
MRSISLAVLAVLTGASVATAGEAFTIHDALNQAVQTNPGVGEAAANRRATEAELRQSQGTLLPQVRLQADAGPERLRRDIFPAPINNGEWQRGREASIVVRQTLFDGFSSINQVWRQYARVDAAAHRVHERTELIALDAAEAYIDVTRYMRLVALAQENLAAHRKIFSNVQARFTGGRSGEGDIEQARERVQGAEAALHEFRRSLEDARAKYRRAVGLEPINLRTPGRLPGLPGSKDDTLAVALRFNPTLRAAKADWKAAKYDFHSTAGAFVPNASIELRHLRGADSITYQGYRTEESAKVVLSWDIFRGGQDAWKRVEAAERMIESGHREARLQRDAFESIDKAWAARTITGDRIAALGRELDAARKVVSAYSKEYELGQRTLIDLLNSENVLFNTYVSLISARGVAVFADYQLLATMGQLLHYLKNSGPPEAVPTDSFKFPLPTRIPPILINAPEPGPEPLKVRAAGAGPDGPAVVRALAERWPTASKVAAIEGNPLARWTLRNPEPVAMQNAMPGQGSALAYAANVLKVPAFLTVKDEK